MYKCPYCEFDLEPCIGENVLGICPLCREIWSKHFHIDVMNNPCPECKKTKAKIHEYQLSYQCLECGHQWIVVLQEGKDPTPEEVYIVDFDTLLTEIKEELQAGDKKHGPMLDPVEGFKTLFCEVAELDREVSRVNKDPAAAKKECLHTITMGVKWLRDCLPMMIEKKEKDNGNT